MTKAKARPMPKPDPVHDDLATRLRAIQELDINVPIYRTRLVGNRLELHLYGGRVLFYPDDVPPTKRGPHAK